MRTIQGYLNNPCEQTYIFHIQTSSMKSLLELLQQETRSKLHVATLSKEIGIEEKLLKSEILEIELGGKIDGFSFEYLTGWMSFANNKIPDQYQEMSRFGKKVMLISIPFLFLAPPIGTLSLFTGFYIWLKSTVRIHAADGRELDLVGAGAIMNSLRF